MDEAWQQRVRGRAYAMWQREGNSDGAPEQSVNHGKLNGPHVRVGQTAPSAGVLGRNLALPDCCHDTTAP